jgi:hypothetical protein
MKTKQMGFYKDYSGETYRVEHVITGYGVDGSESVKGGAIYATDEDGATSIFDSLPKSFVKVICQ